MKNGNEISVKELNSLLEKMKKRLAVSNHSDQTIVNYLRSVEYLCRHTGKHPQDTEIDEIIDYLYQLQYHKFRAWRTIKIYVAGLRWYYTNMLEEEKLAFQIPYPKEEQDLLVVLSRKELFKLFSNYDNTTQIKRFSRFHNPFFTQEVLRILHKKNLKISLVQ